ncbi:MAG TPA: S8 family serine peptidase [Polyangiaceae bacterium]|nr:S8 family serine peptidase [Polyangiaceae bacterium]
MTESNGFDKPNGSNGSSNGDGGLRPGYTGRYLVSFAPETMEKSVQVLKNKAGVSAVKVGAAGPDAPGSEDMVFEEIGVAVVTAHPDQHRALLAVAADPSTPVSVVEPERVVYASMLSGSSIRRASSPPPPPGMPSIPTPFPQPSLRTGVVGLSADFLRGYGAAVEALLHAAGASATPQTASERDLFTAAAGATWGLVATRVLASEVSGKGVKVAILDTGMDLHHPDFAGRAITSRSFVQGQLVQDGHGHGTHCVGVACGPRQPAFGPRYGVAYGANIYVGKVLDNSGRGVDGDILAGINWAVANRCALVSMSLGAPVELGETYGQIYQNAARAAEAKGTLIVAAAGNESHRPDDIRPVGHPANCPTILAVGALDSALQVAYFSCGGLNGDGGEVNIAAPGVDVYSSWPMPQRYNTISGTSMATPCVAGIAALFAESTGLRGLALANHMLQHARRLSPARDFGWGFVQAT